MSELTYTRSGDYLIPDLSLTEQPQAPLGKYGRMRKNYLKEHRPVLWNSLLLSEKLYPHLREMPEATLSALRTRWIKCRSVCAAFRSSLKTSITSRQRQRPRSVSRSRRSRSWLRKRRGSLSWIWS